MNPTFRELDSVVLAHDLPDVGLQAGDLGAIVHLHGSDSFEVEFVTASGRTQNLLRLSATDMRPVGDYDLLAVRSTTRRGKA
jgi:hypothetical protein